MRRVALALALFLVLAAAAPTARPTDPPRSAPVADLVSLAGLAFPTPTAGWVLASRGLAGAEVLGTRDAGASWTVQWSASLAPEQIVATDPDHAWVLGRRCAAETCGSELVGTTDGGAHWSVMAGLPIHIDQVAFESASVGLAAARDASCRNRAGGPPALCPGWVLETVDGGHTWETVMKSAGPIVAVAAGAGRLWALDAAPGAYKPGAGSHPPSLVLFSSGERLSRKSGYAAVCCGRITRDGPVGVGLVEKRAIYGRFSPSLRRVVVNAAVAPHAVVRSSQVPAFMRQPRHGGGLWSARGAIHPPDAAGLDPDVQLLVGRRGRLWLSAFDQTTCAMHGCGLDGAWASPDGGRRWKVVSVHAPFERGIGMPCAIAGPIAFAPGIAAVSFNRQDCAGPASALYRLEGSRSSVVHKWRSFAPAALAWPTSSVGYALGRQSVERSTDGGRTWVQILPAGPSRPKRTQPRFIPQSVSFVSPSVGWAWGPAHWIPSPAVPCTLNGDVLPFTSDAGRGWRELSFGS